MLRPARLRALALTVLLSAGLTAALSPTPAHAAATSATSATLTAQTTALGSWVTVTSRGPASTLWGITTRYYGTGARWTTLWAANRTRVANPNLIYTGQRLWVPASHAATAAPSSSRAQRVIGYALAQRGDPYRWGAAGPNAFDCSGLVVASYARVGIRLPHYTGSLLHHGRPVARPQLRPGDLVFLSSHHVGLYLGGGRVVVAPHRGAVVRVQTIYAYYAGRRLL